MSLLCIPMPTEMKMSSMLIMLLMINEVGRLKKMVRVLLSEGEQWWDTSSGSFV
jgi:hypothetical protein